MDQSDDQFETLLSNLIPRVNKSLKSSNKVDCVGLLLFGEDQIEVFISIIEDDLSKAVTFMQNQLVEIVRNRKPIASCIAYPNYEKGQMIALLENNEHYVAEAHIPVLTTPHLHLDLANLTYHDSAIYLFGE